MAQENIESTLLENRRFPPSNEFVRSCSLHAESLNTLYDKAAADNEGFWAEIAKQEIDWLSHSLKHLIAARHRFTAGLRMVS